MSTPVPGLGEAMTSPLYYFNVKSYCCEGSLLVDLLCPYCAFLISFQPFQPRKLEVLFIIDLEEIYAGPARSYYSQPMVYRVAIFRGLLPGRGKEGVATCS